MTTCTPTEVRDINRGLTLRTGKRKMVLGFIASCSCGYETKFCLNRDGATKTITRHTVTGHGKKEERGAGQ